MPTLAASWNIEKNGASSTDIKQEKVSAFIELCCNKLDVAVIFLCEVHGAQVQNYVSFLTKVYGGDLGQYNIDALPGGHSNAYVILSRKSERIKLGEWTLKGLNRGIILVEINGFNLGLAHFKSGQNGLTKDQIQNASDWLDGAMTGRWALTGDMNWDYANLAQLKLPGGAHAATCWADMTQAKGGILDWCLQGGMMKVSGIDLKDLLHPATYDMTGPDHRPVVFSIDFA